MKRSILCLAVLAMALPVAAMAAVPGVHSAPGAVELSVGGGASVPMGDFNSFVGTGYGVGVNGSYFVTPSFGVGGNIFYNSYNTDDSSPSVDANVTIWEFSGHGKYMFSHAPVSPYAKVSAGVYRSAISDFDGTSSTDMGLGGGIGAQYHVPTSNIGVFGEGMFNTVFTEGSSTNYFSMRVGLNFHITPTP